MARTFTARRLANQRRMDRLMVRDHQQMAQSMGRKLIDAADADGVIPNDRRTRNSLKQRMWEEDIKPYYVGSGAEPFSGPDPQSPYASRLYDGIESATRIEAEREAALLRRNVDPEVADWLTGPRSARSVERVQNLGEGQRLRLDNAQLGSADRFRNLRDPTTGKILEAQAYHALVRPPGAAPAGAYDPFHRFVDPNGYRLSDRVWNTSQDVRGRVDRLVDYHLQRGTSAVEAAKELEQFLTPGARGIKTRRPYGREGSYAARRLMRTEITAAAGRTAMAAADANPFVNRMQWRLSPSHPKIDICDDNAAGGPNGDGTYVLGSIPRYPAHPHCLCRLIPVLDTDEGYGLEEMKAEIQQAKQGLLDALPAQHAEALKGMLNPEFLTKAIMDGSLEDAVFDAVRKSAANVIPKLVSVNELTPLQLRQQWTIAHQRGEIDLRNALQRRYRELEKEARKQGVIWGKNLPPPDIDGIEPMAFDVNLTTKATDDIVQPPQPPKRPELESGATVRQRLLTERDERLQPGVTAKTRQFDELDREMKELIAVPRSQRSEAMRARLREVKKQYTEAQEELLRLPFGDKSERLTTREAHRMLRVPDSERSNFRWARNDDDWYLGQRLHQDESLEFVNSITRGKSGVVPLKKIDNIHERAFWNPRSGGSVHITGFDRSQTVVHEVGHHIENKATLKQKNMRRDFFDRRTAGDEIEQLSNVKGGYGPDEVFKRDKWKHPYTGKIYPDKSSSEVISMGMEFLYDDPVKFADDDPDFFDFIVDYLRS